MKHPGLAGKGAMDSETLRLKNLAALSVWIAGTTHELNNLLGAVLMNVSLGRRFGEGNAKVVERLEEAEKAVAQIKGLINQIHSVGQVAAPKMNPVDLGGLAQQALAALSPEEGEMVEFLFHPPPDEVIVLADPDQAILALVNLMKNAVEANPEAGKGTVMVDLFPLPADQIGPPLSPRRSYWRVAVTDQGGGAPEEILETLMEPGVSTREGRMGLGLPVARVLMRKQGGALGFSPVEGGMRAVADFQVPEEE